LIEIKGSGFDGSPVWDGSNLMLMKMKMELQMQKMQMRGASYSVQMARSFLFPLAPECGSCGGEKVKTE
jgi:hypothetical protein